MPGDANGFSDVFVRDRLTGKTTLVSIASDGTQGNSSSANGDISADGRYVAFSSEADNLVTGDTNGKEDIFVHDLKTGQTSRISVASNGAQGDSGFEDPAISADGRYATFWSKTNKLVPRDTNRAYDVFIRDRLLLPNQKADLSVTQTQSVKTIRKGRPLTYTITVKNNGHDFASDVNLTDLVPLNAQLRSVTSSQGGCYQAPITVCRLGHLAAGVQAKVKLTLKANQTGVLNNTVYVNAPPKDLVPKNNTSTLSTQVK